MRVHHIFLLFLIKLTLTLSTKVKYLSYYGCFSYPHAHLLQQYFNGYDNDGYGIVNLPPPRPRRFYRAVRNYYGPGQGPSIQPRLRRPQQMRLLDFMPPQLRAPSPNAPALPSNFNLIAGPPPLPSTALTNALPQRQNFAITTNATANVTQPFDVNNNNNNNNPSNPNQQQQPQQQQLPPQRNNGQN
jgi:hypothetical protein